MILFVVVALVAGWVAKDYADVAPAVMVIAFGLLSVQLARMGM